MPEKPAGHYIKLHQKYVKDIVGFKYSFEKGDKDPLKKHLDLVRKIPKKSLSGEKAMQIYEKAKKLDLYNYQPVIMRVYLGQLLLKVKPDGSTGFIKFIKLVEAEVASLHPLLKGQIGEVIKLVKTYGGRGGSGSSEYFKKMAKGGKNGAEKVENFHAGRQADPIFDDDPLPISDKTPKPGTLENIGSGSEKLGNLDPFQTVMYKLLIQKGYKEFKRKVMSKTGGWKKLVARKEGVDAINGFLDWIVETTREMSFDKGPGLMVIFNRRLASLNFPSLKIKVAGITVADHRSEAKKLVTSGLSKMRPIIKQLSGFPPALYNILGRTGSYAMGKNRAFLNRFHRIAFNRFKNSSGDQKYAFEFIALALDRIKDDHEFAKLSNAIKPVIAQLLKGVPAINELSKKVFKKPVGQLTQKQIVSLLDYVLPSKALTEDQKQSELNTKMLGILKEFGGQLGSIRKSDPEKYRLIANILHIAKNDVVAIGTEKDPAKAKKQLAAFYGRFQLVRSLIGKKVMDKIQESNKYLYMFLTDPESTLGFACAFNKNLAFVKKKFEAVNKAKKPQVVVAMLKETRVTKKYLQQRFKQAQQSKNVSLIQKYGNQLRSVDMAMGILESCWTSAQFKEKEGAIRGILHETPYILVSKNVQKYIDLVASAQLEKSRRNYRSLLGVTYDVNGYLAGIVRNKLFAGRYSFARDRLSTMISKIVASYGYSVEQKNKAAGINLYTYLKRNQKSYIATIIRRVDVFLKSTRFRDENGKNHRLYGLNRVQIALLERKMNRYVSKKVLPKVKEAMHA